MSPERISVVTPTLRRPREVEEMLDNLAKQEHLPVEVILVDGAPAGEDATGRAVAAMFDRLPFECRYIRASGGTAIQRNVGIDAATGDFIAFIDDDIRLAPDYFRVLLDVLAQDGNANVGGIAGYIENQYLEPARSARWRVYQRLHVFNTFEPGRYDQRSGYPVNRYTQAPHSSVRTIDFFGSNCALWRRAVFDAGLRFDEFFADYGMLEDVHLALRAGASWRLLEAGSARCTHVRSTSARTNPRLLAWKTAVNYRYVFLDRFPNRPWRADARFFAIQVLDLTLLAGYAIRKPGWESLLTIVGKIQGIATAMLMRAPRQIRHLVVFSHKLIWPSPTSPTGFATDGGFPFHMRAISELFESTTLVLPCTRDAHPISESPLTGTGMRVVPLPEPKGLGVIRKAALFFWTLQHFPTLRRELKRADAVHTPIPSDVGTVGMLMALACRKPLLVRHCGDWFNPKTRAERFWKWAMRRFAGGRNVMLATGDPANNVSNQIEDVRWIFSSSLTEEQLAQLAPVSEKDRKGPRILVACRQEERKGSQQVVEALDLIRARFPEATLDVAGDGPALERTKECALSLGLNGAVRFHGAISHAAVLDLMKGSHIFCFPTTASEGFPKAVLEALACGLPVVSTAVSALSSLVPGAGIIVHDVDPRTIAEAVFECWSDAQSYEAMRIEGARKASAYSLERWRATIGASLEASWGKQFRT